MRLRVRLLVVLPAIAFAAGVGAPLPAQAAKPAIVKGTLGGAKLPKASAGVAGVRAVAIDTMAVRDADRVNRKAAYDLRVPAGKYALVTSIVQRGAAAKTVLSGVIRTRAGRTRKLKLSAKKAKRRKRAHRANVNPRDGRAYDGIAVAVKYFTGGTGDLAPLNRGISDMIVTDIFNGAGGCRYTVVEWERRADLQQEIALQQTALVDPSTRVEPGHLIDPELFVTGTISVRGTGPGAALTINAELQDARTGAVRGRASVTDVGANFFDAELRLARDISNEICVIQTGVAAPPTSGGPPSGSSGYTGTVTGSGTVGGAQVSWDGTVVWKVDSVGKAPPVGGFPAGDYATYVVQRGEVEIRISGNDGYGCSFTGTKTFQIPPGGLDRMLVQLRIATPTYSISLGSRIDPQLPITWAGAADCSQNSPAAVVPPFPYAASAGAVLSSSRSLVGSAPASSTGVYDITTKWSLAPG